MFIIHLCENNHAGITVSESFDLEKQQHFAGCVETLCPDGLQRNHSCRLWLILFSLFVVADIILVFVVLLAIHTGDSSGKKMKGSNGKAIRKTITYGNSAAETCRKDNVEK